MSDAPQLRPAIRTLFEPLGLAALGTWGLIVFEQITGLLAHGDSRLWQALVPLILILDAFGGRWSLEYN